MIKFNASSSLIVWVQLDFFKYGAKRLTDLTIPRPLTGIISSNKRLVRFGVRLRRWLLPPLVRTSIPDPVIANRLAVALWVFILYFLVVCLRGTIELLSITQNSADSGFIRGCQHKYV
jgi:hypothetical protein